jgi:putative acetyltransferase
MTIEVRREQPGDDAAIREVNDRAFGQPEESGIVDAARAAGHVTASFVAVDGGTIVGHLLFTPLTVEASAPRLRAVVLGPMAVIPDRQRQGIGSMLVRSGLTECGRLGIGAVVVVGHPEFYPRFGFRRAREYGLRCPFDVADDVFMAVELRDGALEGVTGMVGFIPEFGGS